MTEFIQDMFINYNYSIAKNYIKIGNISKRKNNLLMLDIDHTIISPIQGIYPIN